MLKSKDFEQEVVRGKSFAAAGLCSWAINIVAFNKIFLKVKPKRLALEEAK